MIFRWETVSKLNRVSSSNWKKLFNSNLVYIIFSKRGCKQCEQLESEINSNENLHSLEMCKVVLSDSGLAELKIENKWVSNIDVLPFNVIFSNGKMLESWSGNNIERLYSKLNKYLDWSEYHSIMEFNLVAYLVNGWLRQFFVS